MEDMDNAEESDKELKTLWECTNTLDSYLGIICSTCILLCDEYFEHQKHI